MTLRSVSTFLGIIAIIVIFSPNGQSLSVPSIAIPSLTKPPVSATTSAPSLSPNSIFQTVNNYADIVSNAACEINPTGLLCGTSVAVGHAIIQNLPANATLRHCAVFVPSPHCCAQFCASGAGGHCDADTGACFCGPKGPPSACQLLMNSDTAQTPEANKNMNKNDFEMLNICRQKCASNPNGCTRAAAATDGIVGTVCFCYCDS